MQPRAAAAVTPPTPALRRPKLRNTPKPGQPFRPLLYFAGGLPPAIASASWLSLGARLTYLAIAEHLEPPGGSGMVAEADIARRMARSVRQVRRYLRELLADRDPAGCACSHPAAAVCACAPLVVCKRQGLNLPNVYTCVWHSAFNSLIPQDGTKMSPQDGTNLARQDGTFASGPAPDPARNSLIRQDGTFPTEGRIDLQQIDTPESPLSSPTAPAPKAPPPDRKHAPKWSDSELIRVAEHIEVFLWHDGSQVEPTAELLRTLERIAGRYGATAYQVAAILHRTWTYVVRRPDLWPQKPAWFAQVVRTALTPKPAPPPAPAAAPQQPAPKREPRQERDAHIDGLISELAKRKRL